MVFLRKAKRLRDAASKAVVLVGIIVGITGCENLYGKYDEASAEGFFWESTSPQRVGMDSELLEDMLEYIEEKGLGIDGIIIYKDEAIPFEKYFGEYNEYVSHNMKSTSKGIISALVGIALQEGFIGSLNEKVYDYFPEFEINDPGKSHITIKHLLTMTSGLEWQENNLKSMLTFVSRNRVSKILGLPLVEEPGLKFNYNTGLTHLLSAILTKASGMSTFDFAEKYLFDPLEIYNVQWEQDKEGIYTGGSELFLTPRAMTKFGVLYLKEGAIHGRQIVPSEWVQQSTMKQTEGIFQGLDVDYGYLWWLDIGGSIFPYLQEEDDFLALGVHGQRIFVSNTLNAVIVITADMENETESDVLIRDFVLPAMGSNPP